MQLVPDKFAERVLTGHALHFLSLTELVLGEGTNGSPQDFAVQAILATEVVIDGRLVDPRLGNYGADTSLFITTICKQSFSGL
jgi:hypothetical protein